MKYTQIVSQIQDLKREAEKARKSELASVLKEIKRLISEYGIGPEDLGFTSAPNKASPRGGKRIKSRSNVVATKKSFRIGQKVPPKYQDDQGNTWTGRGKQPKWLVSALASGATLESLLITR